MSPFAEAAGTAANLMSTGQAARLCAVKPDTVLKWIKSGRLPATRTAGGHYRVAKGALRNLTHGGAETVPEERAPGVVGRPLRCWEYLSDLGEIREGCLKCVVYRVRAAWCFEMTGFAGEVGHAKQFCGTSCEDCAYYQRTKSRSINALIVTCDDGLIQTLRSDLTPGVSLRFARNGYETSAIVGEFRPIFVIVDEEMVLAGEPGLLDCLSCDPRVAGLKIVLAAEPGGGTRLGNRKDVLCVIEKPFDRRKIADVVQTLPVEAVPAGMLI
jgi:excisionase family DNA binding protein